MVFDRLHMQVPGRRIDEVVDVTVSHGDSGLLVRKHDELQAIEFTNRSTRYGFSITSVDAVVTGLCAYYMSQPARSGAIHSTLRGLLNPRRSFCSGRRNAAVATVAHHRAEAGIFTGGP